MLAARIQALFAALLCSAIANAQNDPAAGHSSARPDVTVHQDLGYLRTEEEAGRRNRLDLYVPTGVQRPPLVVFIHGGAWVTGDKRQFIYLGETFARHGYAAALINYRLAPQHRHPAHIEDCATAVAWLQHNAAGYGCDVSRLFLTGHSAGGHLATLLAVAPEWLRAAGGDRTQIRAVVPMSAPMDVQVKYNLLTRVFGNDPATRREASPIMHVHTGQPPMLLLWAENDMTGIGLSNYLFAVQCSCVWRNPTTVQLEDANHVDYVLQLGRRDDPVMRRIVTYLDDRCAALAGAPQQPK